MGLLRGPWGNSGHGGYWWGRTRWVWHRWVREIEPSKVDPSKVDLIINARDVVCKGGLPCLDGVGNVGTPPTIGGRPCYLNDCRIGGVFKIIPNLRDENRDSISNSYMSSLQWVGRLTGKTEIITTWLFHPWEPYHACVGFFTLGY